MHMSGNIKSFKVKLRELMAMPAFPVLLALSAAHSLNDLLQSVISAVYPMLKEELSLDFAQIGLITLVYQISPSFSRWLALSLTSVPSYIHFRWVWSLHP